MQTPFLVVGSRVVGCVGAVVGRRGRVGEAVVRGRRVVGGRRVGGGLVVAVGRRGGGRVRRGGLLEDAPNHFQKSSVCFDFTKVLFGLCDFERNISMRFELWKVSSYGGSKTTLVVVGLRVRVMGLGMVRNGDDVVWIDGVVGHRVASVGVGSKVGGR